MRTAPNDLGVVQRQVTARQTNALRAPHVQAEVVRPAVSLSEGLSSFLSAAHSGVSKALEVQEDAQAVAADVGYSAYSEYMGNAIKTQPDLLERPDELNKLDTEARERYFANIGDGKIRERVTQKVDSWLGTQQETYAFNKQHKQRMDLSAAYLLKTYDGINSAMATNQVSHEDAVEQVRFIKTSLVKSESFRLTDEQAEELITAVQKEYATEGSKMVLLAEAFMEDESFSPEFRLQLRASHAKGMAMTETEKQGKVASLYKEWGPMLKKGALRWSHFDPAIKSGLISAATAQTWLNRQQTEVEKQAKDAQEAALLRQTPPELMSSKQLLKWQTDQRSLAEATGDWGMYHARMKHYGASDPVIKARAGRAMATVGSEHVSSPEEVPELFKTFLKEAEQLQQQGVLGLHTAPEVGAELGLALTLTGELGLSAVQAHNALVDAKSSKFSDIAVYELQNLTNAIRETSELKLKGVPSHIPAAAAHLAFNLKKAGYSTEDAVATATNSITASYMTTDYGAIPHSALGGTLPKQVTQRVDVLAAEVAKNNGLDTDDVAFTTTPTGNINWYLKGGDGLANILYQTNLSTLTTNATSLPDGSLTPEGKRQEKAINDSFDSRGIFDFLDFLN